MYNHVFLFCHSSILIVIDVISIGKKKIKNFEHFVVDYIHVYMLLECQQKKYRI